MKFNLSRIGIFELLAYIKEISSEGSLLMEVKLFKNGEEIFSESSLMKSLDIQRFCEACGENVFNERSLTIRVENFLPREDGGLILVKLKTICKCRRKRYKRVFLPGGNFVDMIPSV